jgi:hypothetical protein
MTNGSTVIARIIAIWLLILAVGYVLLFAIGEVIGGSDANGLAILEGLVFILVLEVSLILAIVIYFAVRAFRR